MKQLPEAELKVMLALWQAGEAVPRQQLEARLAKTGWRTNTVNTLLARLVEKGFVQAEKAGRGNLYTALVSQEEYQRYEGSTVLERLYGSSMKNFVAALAGTDKMTQDDIRELEVYLQTLKERDGK